MTKRLGAGNKDVEKLAIAARKQKWVVKITNGGHIQFKPPDADKQIVIHSLTASDHRAFYNLKSRLRRNGLKI